MKKIILLAPLFIFAACKTKSETKTASAETNPLYNVWEADNGVTLDLSTCKYTALNNSCTIKTNTTNPESAFAFSGNDIYASFTFNAQDDNTPDIGTISGFIYVNIDSQDIHNKSEYSGSYKIENGVLTITSYSKADKEVKFAQYKVKS